MSPRASASRAMHIPEDVLSLWSRPGEIAHALRALSSVERALASGFGAACPTFEVYWQGSFAMGTQLPSARDVDLIVEATHADWHRIEDIPANRVRDSWTVFRERIIDGLKRQFGSDRVSVSGSKSIRIERNGDGLTVDVIPCFRYPESESLGPAKRRIIFWNLRTGEPIINCPQAPVENITSKDADNRTNGQFRRAVRMFKTSSNLLPVDQSRKRWPPYYVASLLMNVPDDYFVPPLQDTWTGCLTFLESALLNDSVNFVTASGQSPLFGVGSGRWDLTRARQLVFELERFQASWRDPDTLLAKPAVRSILRTDDLAASATKSANQ